MQITTQLTCPDIEEYLCQAQILNINIYFSSCMNYYSLEASLLCIPKALILPPCVHSHNRDRPSKLKNVIFKLTCKS